MSDFKYKKPGVVAAFILMGMLACSMTSEAVEKKSAEGKNRVAVVSFQAQAPEAGKTKTVFCPICNVGAAGGQVLQESEKIVEEIFMDKLGSIEGIEIVPAERVHNAYKKILAGKADYAAATLQKVGKESGADFLAVGYVYRYEERVGYKYSAEHPASVVFEIHLINTADGRSVWRGFFDKTQKSLMENVLDVFSFFKGGAQWVTARQLTVLGMDDIFETFPDLQD